MVQMSSCSVDKPRDKSVLSSLEAGRDLSCNPKKEMMCVSAGPASGLGTAALKTARELSDPLSTEMVLMTSSQMQDDEGSEYFTLPACMK